MDAIEMVICVIGLGQIGCIVAKYIKAKGYDVYGLDSNPVAVEYGVQNGKFKATTQWGQLLKAGVYIFCVTTNQVNNQTDCTSVFEVSKKIAEKTNANTIVYIESIILLCTVKKIFEEIFKGKCLFVHVPHRYWVDQKYQYGVNQVRVNGGINIKSLEACIKFYKEQLGISMHKIRSIEEGVLEMCKIIENSHRYLQIVFAEDLKMMCNHIDINVDEMREAMNTKWNVGLPEARDDISRHCLPKDIQYFTALTLSILLSSVIEAADQKYQQGLTK